MLKKNKDNIDEKEKEKEKQTKIKAVLGSL